MRQRLHPARTLLLFLVLATLSTVWAPTARALVPLDEESFAWLETAWRPDPERVLATLEGRAIDQEEVYLWELVNGRDPLVARIPETMRDAPTVRGPLERAIRDYAEALAIRERLRPIAMTPTDAPAKAARLRAGAAGLMLLADRTILPTIEVTPIDVRYYYRANPQRFVRPARLDFVRLAIPVIGAEGEAGLQAALSRARELRAEAEAGEGLVPLLERFPEYALDAPVGRSTVVRQGEDSAAGRSWDALSALRISQISEPLPSPGAIVLYELRDRVPERRRTLEDVEVEIRQRLERKHFVRQVRLLVNQLLRESYPLNQARHYAILEPPMTMLRVGPFEVTRAEFDAIHPELSAETGVRPRLRGEAARRILRTEAVTQRLEREGLASEPFYLRALEQARLSVQIDGRMRELRETLAPTGDEVRAFLDAHRERFAPEITRVLWKLEIRPAEPERLTLEQRDRMMVEGIDILSALVVDAERLLDDRAMINGPIAYASPQVVVGRLLPSDRDSPFRISFEMIGERGPWTAREEYGAPFETFGVGEFSDPLPQPDGSVVMYYAADEAEADPLPSREALRRAREALASEVERREARERLDTHERSGQFRFEF